MSNILEVKFSAKSENESLSRVIVASFAAKLDPTLDELSDIKTAVSEAVTNAIIHGYDEDESKFVYLRCEINDRTMKVVVEDRGNVIRYQKKCDACGYLVPGVTMTGAGAKGSKLSSSFRCPKCGRNVKMLLQY